MWALLHVPLAAERAQLLLLQRTFPDRVAAVAQRIEALEQGYHVLMRSEDLPQLLLLVRGIANILNHSTTSYRPQTVVIPTKGFSLDSLSNLTDTRCTGVQGSLLDYVAFSAQRLGVDLVRFKNDIAGAVAQSIEEPVSDLAILA